MNKICVLVLLMSALVNPAFASSHPKNKTQTGTISSLSCEGTYRIGIGSVTVKYPVHNKKIQVRFDVAGRTMEQLIPIDRFEITPSQIEIAGYLETKESESEHLGLLLVIPYADAPTRLYNVIDGLQMKHIYDYLDEEGSLHCTIGQKKKK